MPSEASRIAQRLLDIIGNIDAARRFVSSLSFAEFEADQRTVYATLRALEIVSEASRHLPEAMRKRHPQIAWKNIRDAGNLYRHEYLKVSCETVWETVTESLPPLREVIVDELRHLGYGHLVEKP